MKITRNKIKIIINNRVGLLLISLFSSFIGYSQQYNYNEFSEELPQPYIYSIIQDNKGFLWIGTGNGLSKYDGFKFDSFSTEDSLADNFITSAYNAGDTLWFGHMNGKITRYHKNNFSPVPELDMKSTITDIERSPNGSIWAASFGSGLIKLDSEIMGINDSLLNKQMPIFTFKFLTDNQILVGSINGLSKCSIDKYSGEIILTEQINQIPFVKIVDIIEKKDRSGFFVATENHGIYSLKTDGEKLLAIHSFPDSNFTGVQSLFEDSDSNIWVGTFGNGIVLFPQITLGVFGSPTYFNEKTGFSGNNIKTVYADSDGNIWSGTFGKGLTQITKKIFSTYSFNDKYGIGVSSIFISDKHIWLATEKGLLQINQQSNDVIEFFPIRGFSPFDKITSIFVTKNDIILIGTEKNGIYQKNIGTKSFEKINISDGVLENSITSIAGKDSLIWIGTKKGLSCYNILNNYQQWFTIEKGGLPHNYVNHVFIDSKQRVWVSMLENTLAFIENNKVNKIKVITDNNNNHTLRSITEDKDSVIWVCSDGCGVFRINVDSIVNITSKQGLLSNYCYSLLGDDKNVWVGHKDGISKIRISDLHVKPFLDYIETESKNSYIRTISKDNHNNIWFVTSKGLHVYNPNMESEILNPPVLSITSLKVNNNITDYSERIVLPKGKYDITIEFIGINLKEPQLVKYHYHLDGFDLNPVTTFNNKVEYSGLKSGQYTFKLWATSGDGVSSELPIEINITIETPIWEKWWFPILAFALLFFVVIIIVIMRDFKHLQEKKTLDIKVNERTSELAKKNLELEQSHLQIYQQNEELQKYRNYLEQLVEERTNDLLKAKNKAEESDSLKTAFLQNMSHEIRTPMNGILGFIGLLKEPDLTATDKEHFIDIINKSGERLLKTINNIIEISKIESNQINVNYSAIYLPDIMEQHLNFFMPQANAKGLELTIDNQIAGDKALIETDLNILNSILTNLINNAIKFTKKGNVVFGNSIEDNIVTFYVKDSGIGIPPKRINAIFDRFVQADNKSNRMHEGSGLGLAIIKEYLQLLDGKIWVESELEKGSVFYFSLPIKKNLLL